MKDFIEIGAGPDGEPCAQVGSDNYVSTANEECRRYIDLIRRKFGHEPEGARLKVKGFEHDFGRYYEVCVFYDDDLPESVEYAYAVEARAPETWRDDLRVNWRRVSDESTV